MNLIKKAANYIIGNTEKTKLEVLLNHLIDTIEISDDVVIIKTSKNIIVENDGNFISFNSGMNVSLAKQIHLNPKITFDDCEFVELEDRLVEAEKEATRKLEQMYLESNCDHNH